MAALSLFGGLLFGSGLVVLFSNQPLYPQPIAGMFVVVGAIMMAIAIGSDR